MDIRALWHDNISIEWWKMLLIGLFFLIVNLGIFLATWYARYASALEFGYPKKNKKSIKKKTREYSFWDKLLLIKVTKETERKGIFLYINLINHFINIIGYGCCVVGFFGSLITLADGWALTLLVGSELIVLFVTTLIEFIPHLIWLPSEQKRFKA